jgi:two-component system, LytTR family, response regulator
MIKIKTVVIDDEFLNRQLITMLIVKLNTSFKICGQAENLEEGHKLISEVQPHVVFLDIKMPDGTGFDLLKRFGKRDFEVVFITGFDEDALKALDSGSADYILKPIDMDKLKEILDRIELRIKRRTV